MYDACEAMSTFMKAIGVAVDGGKVTRSTLMCSTMRARAYLMIAHDHRRHHRHLPIIIIIIIVIIAVSIAVTITIRQA